MTDDSQMPPIYEQGEMLDKSKDESIRPEAMPIEKEAEESIGIRQAREAAESQGHTYYGDIKVPEEIAITPPKTEATRVEAAEEPIQSDEMTPADKLEMCEIAASSYFGVTAKDFVENFDHWAEEYEKETSDRQYKNKIWFVAKLINGDSELKASVVNQAKLEEIASRL